MQKQLSLAVFTDWLNSQSAELFEEITGISKKEQEKTPFFEIDLFLTAASELFSAWIRENGLWFDEETDTICYDPDKFGVIALQAACVMADYDWDEDSSKILAAGGYSTNPDDYEYKDGRQASRNTPWNRWNLRGDDDVDYNGSYIAMALDALLVYEREKGK